MYSKQKILVLIITLILIIFPLVIVFGDKGLVDLYNLKQKQDNLVQNNAEIQKNIIELNRITKRLREKDPVLIERLARDELNMVRKEDVILKPVY